MLVAARDPGTRRGRGRAGGGAGPMSQGTSEVVRRRRTATRSASMLALLLVALVVGRWTRLPETQLALLWPAAGVAVWWFLPRRPVAWLVLDSVLLVVAVAVVNLLTGATAWHAAGFAVANLVHALVGGWASRRSGVVARGLRGGRGPVRLLLASAAAGLVSGALLVFTAVSDEPVAVAGTFLLAWVRNTTGTFLVLVVVLAVVRPHRGRELLGPPRAREWWTAVVVGVALYTAVFDVQPGLPLGFLLLPLVVWSGTRLGLARTSALSVGLGVLAVLLTLHGTGGFSATATPAGRAGVIQGFILLTVLTSTVLAAVTEDRERIATALAEARSILARSVDAAMIGSGVVLTGGAGTGLLLQPNPALRRLLGLDGEGTASRGGAVRPSWTAHLGPEDAALMRDVLAELAAGTRQGWTGELQHRLADSSTVWAQVHLSALEPAQRGRRSRAVVAQFLDITARKDAEAQLTHLALHDDLTGLPNRLLLRDRLELALAAVGRSHSHVAVVFLDLDRFKTINDSLGHEAGDRVLVTVAKRLRATLRPTDTVARIGGDEFVACCPDVADLDEAHELAARLVEVVSSPVPVDGRVVPVAVSAGLTLSRPGDTASSLLQQSDAAMYAAKKAGRGRVEVFAQGLEAQASRHLVLSAELRDALVHEQFRMHYQPVVDLDTGTVTACEALVRWQHPTRGLLAPAEWLDVAEQTDLMLDLGEWVLRRACADLAGVAETVHPLKVHVNVSGRQLAQPGVVDVVAAALRDTALPAHLVVLELTETHLLELHGSLLADLSQLHRLGVELAVDDFGTGFSSLTQLVRLPLDSVKIDRSFVGQAAVDEKARAVVGGVLGMADALGLQVVAEGVETPAQAALLRTMGCVSGQGFLWSPPVPLDRFVELLVTGFPASVTPRRRG